MPETEKALSSTCSDPKDVGELLTSENNYEIHSANDDRAK